ncbi:MAG: MBOAT family protein [Chitinophagaceae bacterium]|nr:MAG: MBOAT family protein [Chitinophagaceae bacterium]
MLFNSLSFTIFLPIVFLLYWFVTQKNLKVQNLLLLVSSYFFYACWDYRFLFLLMFSTLLDYFTGLKMEQATSKGKKKFWFWLSVIINLGFLAVFKYYNFFIDSFSDGLSMMGIQANFWTLNIILPVGISFYTFHGLSYVIDIYNDKIKAEKNFVEYAVFVSFFPLLVAGPIERATHLLPQIKKPRVFNYTQAIDGLRQILWGLFKKIVIADSCAEYANIIFNNSESYSGAMLVLGALFFTFQIYCDFSGYSDIALGTARLFGIELLRNFAFPYFSRDIAEFWRRWHISLSSWFRDYLYIPLGGSKGGTWMKVRNTFIIFIVSGFWHGANWTFIMWGLLNALYIMPSILFNTNRNNLDIVAQGKIFPTVKELLQMIATFTVTVIAWIFFRAESIAHAFVYIRDLFAGLFSAPAYREAASYLSHEIGWAIPALLVFFMIIEWLGREQQYAIQKFGLGFAKPVRWAFYYSILLIIFYFAGTGKEQEFIYFQF